MSAAMTIRPLERRDWQGWLPLWDGYNAFYGRSGATALDEAITAATWERFFDEREPVHAVVAEAGGELLGTCHFLYHRSTTRLRDVCYLQDLFTAPQQRGRGVGRALIQHVFAKAREASSSRVYWTTQTTNVAGRALYDQLADFRGFIVYSREIPPDS